MEYIALYLISLLRYKSFGNNKNEYVRVAQLDRASGYGPEGREFESSRARRRNPCLI